MQKPTKVLLIGLTVGALLIGIDYGNRAIGERQIAAINSAALAGDLFGADGKKLSASEAARLRAFDQWDETKAIKARMESTRALVEWGFGIALLSCVPYTWYAFLRRLRELREAIMGK